MLLDGEDGCCNPLKPRADAKNSRTLDHVRKDGCWLADSTHSFRERERDESAFKDNKATSRFSLPKRVSVCVFSFACTHHNMFKPAALVNNTQHAGHHAAVYRAPPRHRAMASVFLGDLDDFIAPGQACINPLFTTAVDAAPAAAAAAEKSDSKGGAAMVLELEDDGGPLDAMVGTASSANDALAGHHLWILDAGFSTNSVVSLVKDSPCCRYYEWHEEQQLNGKASNDLADFCSGWRHNRCESRSTSLAQLQRTTGMLPFSRC